ncbi:GNAT family N-acetyltransferase [Arenibacter sp. M-2]|uniref:GNAT family N-acetyltransferase n=1 Tax=Arenibacter sp. M-2 TaxID=3053612 RepID=UPI0025701285|nr:GNAT family N-acetyltransferase [Arenibacter sp. M-2]MDL5510921.1 GNAT family N-acetyltransferase [Arenibacter sp. M-2]|tara:strand:+ start:57983 stop:58432 length:450 start_codon:yes stop_codon:yes gene_type:complete
MIKKITHSEISNAEKLHTLFQESYRIEADLLGVSDFPPLQRTTSDFQNRNTQFYGVWKGEVLAAAVEINQLKNTLEICSLVVHPKYFRQGIARKLLLFVEDYDNSETLIVETGWANAPAINLYEKFGFQETGEYIGPGGIKKKCFSKTK